MAEGVYARRMSEHICQFCGKKFMSFSSNAKCCGSEKCEQARRLKHRAAMREWKRKSRAMQKANEEAQVKEKMKEEPKEERVSEKCGQPVDGRRKFCADCMKKRLKEKSQIYWGVRKIRGGDGTGKWRARADSRKKIRIAYGVHLRDADVVAGASAPYMDPECTRVEWRR